MGPVSADIEIDLPRERVFEAISDFSRRPAFTDHFQKGFHLTRLDPVGVGAGARFQIAAPLRSVWMDSAIDEVEPPHKIVEHGSGGRANRIPTTTVWDLREGPGGLTKVHVSFWTEPSNPVDRLVESLSGGTGVARRGWQEALRRLREQLEAEARAAGRVATAGGNRYATGIP